MGSTSVSCKFNLACTILWVPNLAQFSSDPWCVICILSFNTITIIRHQSSQIYKLTHQLASIFHYLTLSVAFRSFFIATVTVFIFTIDVGLQMHWLWNCCVFIINNCNKHLYKLYKVIRILPFCVQWLMFLWFLYIG